MIGVLCPQPPPSYRKRGARLVPSRFSSIINNKKGVRDSSGRRYLAKGNSARQSTSLVLKDPEGDDCVENTPSPDFLGDRYNDSTGDGRFHSSSRSKSFAVTVLVYASDGHQVPKLRDAKVGTICVAVALQSLKQASRAIWSAANGVATDIGDELASTRAVLGCRVIQILLGRIRKFRRRSRNVACLVLYWKFPGAIVAFPLDSGVFRLRNHVDVDKSEAGGMNCETKMCWTLPEKGFHALRALERSVAPGLPALARDMINDENCLNDASLTAETLSLKLGNCHVKDPSYVVVPHMAGILFVSLGTISHSSQKIAATKAKAVLARLDEEGDAGMQRYVLEECDMVCSKSGGVLCTGVRRRLYGRCRRRHIPLPVTYADLLGEARSQSPTPGSIFSRRMCRWRWSQYHAGPSSIVPDVGEDVGPQALPLNAAPARIERTRGVVEQGYDGWSEVVGKVSGKERSQSGVKSRRPQLLSSFDVHSASLDQATLWASTRGLIRALLAAACPRGEHAIETKYEGEASVSCTEARNTACDLLGKVFGKSSQNGEQESLGNFRGKIESTLLDQWYENVCLFTDPLGGDRGLLLLEGLLEIPSVRAGFIQRGLLRYLARVLQKSLSKIPNERELYYSSCPGDGYSPEILPPKKNEAGYCSKKKEGDTNIRPREATRETPQLRGHVDPWGSPEKDFQGFPWWLFGGGQGDCQGGSADGDTRGSIDSDESCKTVSDRGFTPGEEESGSQLNREDYPTDEGSSTGDNPGLGEVLPGSTVTEYGAVRDSAECSTAKGRVAPPMLRLDALDCILGSKEWGSPRSCSSHAVATLSAASTRATAHLVRPTFRSARGATSRISARHGSERSTRTGLLTQRDSISTGCPTGRNVVSPVPIDLEITSRPPSGLSIQPRHSTENPPEAKVSQRKPNLIHCDEGHSTMVSTEGGGGPRLPLSDIDGNSLSLEPHIIADDGAIVDPPLDGTAPRLDESNRREEIPLLRLAGLAANTGNAEKRGLGIGDGTRNFDELNPSDPQWVPHRRALAASLPPTDEHNSNFQRENTVGLNSNYLSCVARYDDVDQRRSSRRPLNDPLRAEEISCISGPDNNSPMNLVLSLARASAPVSSSSSARGCRGRDALVFSQFKVAKLLVSLLPSTSNEQESEKALGTALDGLSFVGALLLAGAVVRVPFGFSFDPKGLSEHDGSCSIRTRHLSKPTLVIWPPELDTVDTTSLVRAIEALLVGRCSVLESHLLAACEVGFKEVCSSSHRQWVHTGSQLGLECIWLSRLLLHRILSTCELDDKWQSSLSAEVATLVMECCGRILSVLLPYFCEPFSSLHEKNTGDGSGELSPFFDAGKGCTNDAELLILTAPVVVDLTASVVALLRQPTAWSQNTVWAATTLGSMAASDHMKPTPPALVEQFVLLVASAALSESRPMEIGGEQLPSTNSLQETARILANKLTGGANAIDEVVLSTLQSLEAILCRSKMLLEMSQDSVQPGGMQDLKGASSGTVTAEYEKYGKGSSPYSAPVKTGRYATFETEGEKEKIEKTGWESYATLAKEAVSRVARGMAPIFHPRGGVLAILNAQLLTPQSDGARDERDVSSGFNNYSLESTACSTLCLGTTLRLSAVFFSIWARACDTPSGDKHLVRLEEFAAPLYGGVCDRWNIRVLEPEGAGYMAHPTLPERDVGVLCGLKTEEEYILSPRKEAWHFTCRLYLEALVALASTEDPTVLKWLLELRVAEFLKQNFLCKRSAKGQDDMEGAPVCFGRPRETSNREGLSSGYAGHCAADLSARKVINSEKKSPSSMARVLGEAGAVVQAMSGLATAGDTRGPNHDEKNTPISLPPSSTTDPIVPLLRQDSQADETMDNSRVEPEVKDNNGKRSSVQLVAGYMVDGLVTVKGGRPRWFAGRIERVNKDGTLHVCYDDGDEDCSKCLAELRTSQRRAGRVKQSPVIGRDTPRGEECSETVARGNGTQQVNDPCGVLKGKHADEGWETTKNRETRSTEQVEPQANNNRCTSWVDGCQELSLSDEGAAETKTGVNSASKLQSTWPLAGRTSTRDAAASAACLDGSVGAGEDAEDDEMYFAIPSVLNAEFSKDARPLVPDPVSVIPRIDLNSPVFHTRVHSSQLGPGSSLSTPTTGGCIRDMPGGVGGPCSGTAPGTFFPKKAGKLPYQRPVSFQDNSFHSRSSILALPRASSLLEFRHSSAVRAATTLPISYRPTTAKKRSAPAIVGLSTDEDELSENAGEPRQPAFFRSEASDFPASRWSNRTLDEMHVADTMPEDHQTVPVVADGDLNGAGNLVREKQDDKGSCYVGSHRNDNLRKIQKCAIALLLSIACMSRCHDISTARDFSEYSPSSDGWQEGHEFTANTILFLQSFFGDPQNTNIVVDLKARWGQEISIAESTRATLAKLVSSALFDKKSYSLDGDHVAAGRFGGIIVSRCPLPLEKSRYLVPAAHRRKSIFERGGDVSIPNTSLGVSLPDGTRRQAEEEIEEVALKVVDRDELNRSVGLNIFVEVLALRTLSEVPGVCRLFDFGITSTSYVLVLERCVQNLTNWRAKHRRGKDAISADTLTSDDEVVLYLLIFRQIVYAVAAMAERGVVHLDLKCDNILVRRKCHDYSSALGYSIRGLEDVPSICVADFGESVIGHQQQPPDLTPAFGNAESDDRRIGTFEFNVRGARGTERIQSPEMILLAASSSGRGIGSYIARPNEDPGVASRKKREAISNISTASDVWSLGCLLYELLSGKFLFGNMPWSEFFVTLTAGVIDHGRSGEVADAEGVEISTPSLLPLPIFGPFAALHSAKALRKLLESILVRNPIVRPSASRSVQHVDDALASVVPPNVKNPVGEAARVSLPISTGHEKMWNKTTHGSKQIRAHIVTEEKTKPADGKEPSLEATTAAASCSRVAQEKNSAKEMAQVDEAVWALQPCAAVAVQQRLATKQSFLSGCDGCLYRLGAGAFLLLMSSSSRSHEGIDRRKIGNNLSNNVGVGRSSTWSIYGECNSGTIYHEPEETMRVGPETMVYLTNFDESDWVAAGNFRGCCSSLGSALSTLAINHVVCVMSLQEGKDTSNMKDHTNPFLAPQTSMGSRLLGVHMQVDDLRSVSLAETSPAEFVEDLVAFATGPRVIFVGMERDRGAAAAVSMSWAMGRTGKGSYETMLDFRQSCVGFWVDPSTLRAVIDYSKVNRRIGIE